jgi:hypothetical protein
VLAKGSTAAAGLPESMVYSNSMDCVRKMVRGRCVRPKLHLLRPIATISAALATA